MIKNGVSIAEFKRLKFQFSIYKPIYIEGQMALPKVMLLCSRALTLGGYARNGIALNLNLKDSLLEAINVSFRN